MITFSINSYQRKDPPKWVPSATLYETIDGKETGKRAYSKILFDTKEEADEFIKNYYLQRGFKYMERR